MKTQTIHTVAEHHFILDELLMRHGEKVGSVEITLAKVVDQPLTVIGQQDTHQLTGFAQQYGVVDP